MNNGIIKHIVLWGGLLLIVTAFSLLKSKFPTEEIFTLDIIVALLVYLCNWLSFGGIFTPASSFTNKVVSLGITMYTNILYTILAIAGIIGSLFVSISIEWQCIYQGAILLLAIMGIYTASAAESREAAILHKSQQEGKSIDRIKAESEQLLMTATTSAALDTTQRNKIRSLTERTRFISPNNSSIATALDKEICTELAEISKLAQTLPATSVSLNASLLKCEKLITERIKKVITP